MPRLGDGGLPPEKAPICPPLITGVSLSPDGTAGACTTNALAWEPLAGWGLGSAPGQGQVGLSASRPIPGASLRPGPPKPMGLVGGLPTRPTHAQASQPRFSISQQELDSQGATASLEWNPLPEKPLLACCKPSTSEPKPSPCHTHTPAGAGSPAPISSPWSQAPSPCRGPAPALLRRLLTHPPLHPLAVHQPLPRPFHHLHHRGQRHHHVHGALQPAQGGARGCATPPTLPPGPVWGLAPSGWPGSGSGGGRS